MFDISHAPLARSAAPVPVSWPVWSRADLVGSGLTWRHIGEAVAAGAVHRARRNAYLPGDVDAATLAASEIGGQLACVSELARRGVFVLDSAVLHVRVPARAGRLRGDLRRVRVHWNGACRARVANVELLDALTDAVQCQGATAAIATLDSALNRGLLDENGLAELARRLPQRQRVLLRLVDAAAEAGSESSLRLVLRRLGFHVESQVSIPGVGRVDFLVDGWLIIECDSEAHHADWAQQKRDRRRDQAAAALGYATYRPIAEDIFWHREAVIAALVGLREMWAATAARRAVTIAGDPAPRTRKRRPTRVGAPLLLR